MRHAILTGSILFLLFRHAQAAESQGLTAAVDAVLAHHFGLKAAEARVRQAEAGGRESQAMRLPMLSARSSWTRGDHPVYVFGSLMEQGRFGPSNFAIDALNHPGDLSNIKSGLDLGIPLFTGFQLTSAIRQAEWAGQAARQSRDGVRLQLRQKTAGLFLRLLSMKAMLKELDERLSASKEELEEARRLKERGVVLGSDYYAAQAVYGGLRAWTVQLQGQARAAQTELDMLSGAIPVRVEGTLGDATYPVPSADDAQGIALTHRPELGASAAQSELAKERGKQARWSVLPRVEGFASLETNTNDFSSNPTNHLFGVAAKLPFGDPGYLARRDRGALDEAAARETESDARETISIEARQAHQRYQSIVESLPMIKESADHAARSLELFRPLYRSGRQSILDVLQAEDHLARARVAYWQTLGDAHAAYIGLMAAMGTLDDQAIRTVAAQMEKLP